MFKHIVLDIVRYLFSSKEKMQILLKKSKILSAIGNVHAGIKPLM